MQSANSKQLFFYRLTNLLRNRDGAGWREKLPKSESYANLQKLAGGSNGQETPRISSESAPISNNAQIPEAKPGSPKVPKIEVDIDQVQEQFRNIKEKGNQFVQKVRCLKAFFLYFSFFTIYNEVSR